MPLKLRPPFNSIIDLPVAFIYLLYVLLSIEAFNSIIDLQLVKKIEKKIIEIPSFQFYNRSSKITGLARSYVAKSKLSIL